MPNSYLVVSVIPSYFVEPLLLTLWESKAPFIFARSHFELVRDVLVLALTSASTLGTFSRVKLTLAEFSHDDMFPRAADFTLLAAK